MQKYKMFLETHYILPIFIIQTIQPNEFSLDYCKQNNNNAPHNFPPENVTCAWSECIRVSLYRR